MGWTVVGVHCAAREDRLGLVHGELHDDAGLEVIRATLGTAGESPAHTIASWLGTAERHILAVDAPLGWPSQLGRHLVAHRAGDPLDAKHPQIFHRQTDDFVHAATRRRPPAVAAHAVAHTTRAALSMLEQVRGLPGAPPLPLAWNQGEDCGVVEVYPSATLAARGVPSSGFRGNTQKARVQRAEILERITEEFDMEIRRDLLTENPDIFDALVCMLAGADFIRRQCQEPPDRAVADREGWIWVRLYGQGRLLL